MSLRLRAATREDRQLAWVWAVVAIALLALRPLWLALAPQMPACPLRALTGIPCPSCGTTHAAVAMLNGRLGAALAANPLAGAAGLAFLAGGVLAPLWALARLPAAEIPAPLPRWARLGMLAALAANWAWVIWKT